MPLTMLTQRSAAEPSSAFARLISETRGRANLTQAQLAARSRVSLRTIAYWESGRATDPKLTHLLSVCATLRIPLHEAAAALGVEFPAALGMAA